jgi:hypothetical protein
MASKSYFPITEAKKRGQILSIPTDPEKSSTGLAPIILFERATDNLVRTLICYTKFCPSMLILLKCL